LEGETWNGVCAVLGDEDGKIRKVVRDNAKTQLEKIQARILASLNMFRYVFIYIYFVCVCVWLFLSVFMYVCSRPSPPLKTFFSSCARFHLLIPCTCQQVSAVGSARRQYEESPTFAARHWRTYKWLGITRRPSSRVWAGRHRCPGGWCQSIPEPVREEVNSSGVLVEPLPSSAASGRVWMQARWRHA
jgi:hypothetical protein